MSEYAAEVVRLPDAGSLARAAARRYAELARDAVSARGMFRVALSGGSTPKALYQVLAESLFRDDVPWQQSQIFFSDERFVPLDSEESNYHLAHETLLSRVPIPERFVHPVPTEEITPERSASLYEEGIRRVFSVGLDETPRFDLILLGIGPDGHTASLFPDTDALAIDDALVAPNFVPKLDTWRITFTFRLINAARTVMFLAQGEEKTDRVAEVMARQADLPASHVRPANGTLLWFLDEAAARKVPTEAQ